MEQKPADQRTYAASATMVGGQSHDSDLAITTALMLRAVFRLALRRTEGVIGCSLRARTPPAQKAEAWVACAVINRMAGLGMPVSRTIA